MKQINILILLLFLAFGQVLFAAEAADDRMADQIMINKAMLNSGDQQDIRIVAAKQLLLNRDDRARAVVADVLVAPNQIDAKKAIYLALIESDKWPEKIQDIGTLIEPMCASLSITDNGTSKLACQAFSIFDFENVSPNLKAIIQDGNLPVQTRLNAMSAMKQWLPDKRVIGELVTMLDDKNEQISSAAGQSLQEWVPLGKDKQSWGQVLAELNQKNPEDIVRERLIRQDTKVRQLESELSKLRNGYLEAVEELYKFKIATDARKDFLLKYLKSEQPQVREWAVRMVGEWRTGNPLPADFTPILLEMIADPDPVVRIEVAKLLSNMGDVNPASQLLVQLKKETDDAAAIEELGALGEALYYAFIASSKVDIDPKIKIETLSIINSFINSPNSSKVNKGAQILARILEKNGVGEAEVQKSLNILSQRYNSDKTNPDIAPELIRAMSLLCDKSSHYNSLAGKMFRQIFLEALDSKIPAVRDYAFTGLVNIDPASALNEFRTRKLYEDKDSELAMRVVEMAGEVGQLDDIHWLISKLNTENEVAWQSVLKILQRGDADQLWQWVDRISKLQLPKEKMVEVLELAKKKPGLEIDAQLRLAKIFYDAKDYDKAIGYYKSMLVSGVAKEKADAVNLDLLRIYLATGKDYEVLQLISQVLVEKDIDSSNMFAIEIDNYFKSSRVDKTKKTTLLALLKVMKVEKPRPKWSQLIQSWRSLLGDVPQQQKPTQ